MKTTIDISDALLARARRAARDRGTTLRAIVEEALERALGPTLAGNPPLCGVTWPPVDAKQSGTIDSETMQSILDDARNGCIDDPDYWMRRFGFVPPGVRRK